MDSNHRDKSHVRVELKYCERCGALWVREGGGSVYCEKCQVKVAELPLPKKKPGRLVLPQQRHSLVDDIRPEGPENPDGDLEAEGGAA